MILMFNNLSGALEDINMDKDSIIMMNVKDKVHPLQNTKHLF